MTPGLELIARLEATLAPPLAIGEIPAGLREVIPITGGTVSGPKLNGRILSGGADWCLTRKDGVSEVWARYTIELDDGALVSILNTGMARQRADGDFEGRTTPSFEVAAGPHSWLRDHTFAGTLLARADGTGVSLAFYKVT
jgi:Protein of unknown function (DUF3237)